MFRLYLFLSFQIKQIYTNKKIIIRYIRIHVYIQIMNSREIKTIE